MPQEEAESLETKVRTIVARLAKMEQPGAIPGEANVYDELGVKSSAALELLLSLEETFGVTIRDDAFNDARTINALIRLVEGSQ